jgi:hypothetical protein
MNLVSDLSFILSTSAKMFMDAKNGELEKDVYLTIEEGMVALVIDTNGDVDVAVTSKFNELEDEKKAIHLDICGVIINKMKEIKDAFDEEKK